MRNWFMLFASVTTLGYALYLFFARDKVWEQHVKRQKSMGIKPEMLQRTDEWENRITQTGVMFLVLGTIALGIFLCSPP